MPQIRTILSKMDIVLFFCISARLNQLINIVQFLSPHLRWGSTDLGRAFLTDLKAGKGPQGMNGGSRGVCTWNGLLVVRIQVNPSVSLLNQILYSLSGVWVGWINRNYPRSERSLPMRTAYFMRLENVDSFLSPTTSSSQRSFPVSTMGFSSPQLLLF